MASVVLRRLPILGRILLELAFMYLTDAGNIDGCD